MINSIEIKETIWNSGKEKYEIQYKTVTRDEYSGDYDEFLLDNMKRSEVKDYALEEFNLYEDDPWAKPETEDFDNESLCECLEYRGFIIFEPRSIIEDQKLEKIKCELSV